MRWLLSVFLLFNMTSTLAIEAANDFPLQGLWKIMSYQIVGSPTIDEAKLKEWVGKMVQFSKKEAILHLGSKQSTCSALTYKTSREDAEGYFLIGYKVKPARLGVTAPEVDVVRIRCNQQSWLGEQERDFIQMSSEQWISNWDGVFFFLAKQPEGMKPLEKQTTLEKLIVTPQSVGTLNPDSDFNEKTIREALPGYAIKAAKYGTTDVFEAKKQNKLALRIFPNSTSHKIAAINLFDSITVAPGDIKLGATYAQVFKGELETVDCQPGIEARTGQMLCWFRSAPSIRYVFVFDSKLKGATAEAFKQAKLVELIWTADFSLMKESTETERAPGVIPITTFLQNQPSGLIEPPIVAEKEVAFRTQDKRLNEIYKQLKQSVTPAEITVAEAKTTTNAEQMANTADETVKPTDTAKPPEKLPIQDAKPSGDKPQVPSSPLTLKELMNAQRAWLEYRDANCQLHGTLHAKDTSPPVNSLACLERMTRERAEEVESLLKATQP